MYDESDVAQARVFFQLLLAEADSLTDVIEALESEADGGRRSTARTRQLRAELRQIHGYLDRLRSRFPGVASPPDPAA
jgi:hypothetical protein